MAPLENNIEGGASANVLGGYFRPHTATIDWCEINYEVK